MYKRIFIPLLATIAALFMAGCEQATTAPGVTGYWLQQSDKRPMSLHIKPDGNEYLVNVGRLNFGHYDISAQPAKLNSTDILTIDQRKQVRLDPATDILTDVDHPTIRFIRITQAQYEKAIQLTPASTSR